MFYLVEIYVDIWSEARIQTYVFPDGKAVVPTGIE